MASCPRLRPPRSFCRRAVLLRSYDGAAGGLFLAAAAMTLHRFPSLGLKSRIIASPEPFLRVSLQRFSNSPPQIKNHCTNEGINGRNNAVIRKSEPEIKNRCSRRVVAVCRRNHSPLPLRKLESDANLVAATTTAGGTILLCGNGYCWRNYSSLSRRLCCRRNHFPLPLRKLESDAEHRSRHSRCRQNHSPMQRFPN